VCVCDSLVEQGHRGASLALLDHVGLISEGDAEGRGRQSTRLAVHLHTHTHTLIVRSFLSSVLIISFNRERKGKNMIRKNHLKKV